MCSKVGHLGPDASNERHMTAIQKLAEVCCVLALTLALIYKLMMSAYMQLHLQVSL